MLVRRFLLRLCIEEVLLSIVDILLTPDRFRVCEIGLTRVEGFEYGANILFLVTCILKRLSAGVGP